MGKTQSKAGRFDDETRHNWGFHDALADLEAGRAKRDVSAHFDEAYARGYEKACWQVDQRAKVAAIRQSARETLQADVLAAIRKA